MGPLSVVRCRFFQNLRIDDVDRPAGRKGKNLVKNVDELRFVLFSRDIADVRRRHDLVEAQERQSRIAYRLVFEHIDGGIAGPADAKRGD